MDRQFSPSGNLGHYPPLFWTLPAAQITFEETFRKYLSTRDVRAITLKEYTRDLERVYLHYFCDKLISEVTPDELEWFLQSRKDFHGNCRRTRRKHLLALRGMFKWAITKGYLRFDPTNGLYVKGGAKRKGVALTPEEALRLLAAAKESPAEHVYIALAIFLLAGLRSRNVLELQWLNLDFERCEFSFTAEEMKKHAEHVLHINSQLLTLLRRIYEERNPAPEDFVLGVQIKRLRHSFPNALRRAGLPKKIRVHDLRHTWGTWLQEACLNLPLVGELMAHTPPNITSLYLHFSREQKIEVVEMLPKLLTS